MRSRSLLLAVLFLSAAIPTAPRLLSLTRQAIELIPLNYEERRVRLMGELYQSTRDLGRATAPTPLALIAFAAYEWDRAFFAAYYLYPQPVWPFLRYEHYRDSPRRDEYRTIVSINFKRDQRLKVTTYDDLVEESAPPPVMSFALPRQTGTRFIVPVVLSAYGPIPHDYRTEGVVSSEEGARVEMTLYPAGTRKIFALRPRQPLRFGDVSMEAFGVKTTGWIEVESSHPIRASFWFVDRGVRFATELPLVTTDGITQRTFASAERLWIVNPRDKPVEISVDGYEATLPPRFIWTGRGREVTAGEPVIAFTSSKVDKGVEFTW